MLKKIENKNYNVYEYNDYIVEVYESYDEPGIIEFWLCKKNIGIKNFMYGLYEKDIQDIESIIENTIEIQIEIYEEDYCNE